MAGVSSRVGAGVAETRDSSRCASDTTEAARASKEAVEWAAVVRMACKSGMIICCFLRAVLESGDKLMSCEGRFVLASCESDGSVATSSCSSVDRFFASES